MSVNAPPPGAIVPATLDSTHGPILRNHMPELDTLRGVAVLGVLFYHGLGFVFRDAQLSRIPAFFMKITLIGWMGVNLFFVLSGFLITGILLDTRGRNDYFSRFYKRRALRILPAYYGVLALVAIVLGFHRGFAHIPWGFFAISSIYLSNLADLFHIDVYYGVLWTLAIEEQFYLIWPAVVRLFARVLGWVALSICVLCPILRWIYVRHGMEGNAGYTWLCADGLALGALLAVILRSKWGTRPRISQLAFFLVAASVLATGFGFHAGIWTATTTLGTVLRPPVLSFFFAGLLLATLLLGSSGWSFLANRPLLQWFGGISYGLYLIHMLAFDVTDKFLASIVPVAPYATRHLAFILARFTLGAGLAIGTSFFSRRYFEEAFLRLKRE